MAELDIDGSLLDAIEQELADVERALALLDDGTYGQCEHCDGVIDDDVLARTPTARFCAEHLPLRPALTPPGRRGAGFGRGVGAAPTPSWSPRRGCRSP